ncbi:transposase [Gloeocapsopsis crepidinum LEGE 06123]|uniref:Transposase n=1 Tax=Gloeocapsopsis crepidinum LEGE 06123 TaxID=588587 RepID=A0ABR9UYX4_9CHRO|nr:transposase [Gloeocapsopsis crepidinum]MBE9193494.1 transposase [Gloeocapsopsis crepidinum LEGE 06123]
MQTRDNLVEMFLKQVRKIHHKGKEELQRLQQQHQDTTEKLIGVLANILQVFVDEPTDPEVVPRVNQVLTPAGGVQQF